MITLADELWAYAETSLGILVKRQQTSRKTKETMSTTTKSKLPKKEPGKALLNFL